MRQAVTGASSAANHRTNRTTRRRNRPANAPRISCPTAIRTVQRWVVLPIADFGWRLHRVVGVTLWRKGGVSAALLRRPARKGVADELCALRVSAIALSAAALFLRPHFLPQTRRPSLTISTLKSAVYTGLHGDPARRLLPLPRNHRHYVWRNGHRYAYGYGYSPGAAVAAGVIAGAAAGYPYCHDYDYGSYYGSCDDYSYGYPYPYYDYGYAGRSGLRRWRSLPPPRLPPGLRFPRRRRRIVPQRRPRSKQPLQTSDRRGTASV